MKNTNIGLRKKIHCLTALAVLSLPGLPAFAVESGPLNGTLDAASAPVQLPNIPLFTANATNDTFLRNLQPSLQSNLAVKNSFPSSKTGGNSCSNVVENLIASSLNTDNSEQLNDATLNSSKSKYSSEEATLDKADATSSEETSINNLNVSSHETKFLRGSIKKRHKKAGDKSEGEGANVNLQGTAVTAEGIPQEPKFDTAQLKKASLEKLAHGEKLNSAEYRSLGIGVIGFAFTLTWLSKEGVVERVYAGSPAEKAGIEEGDKIIAADDVYAKKVAHNPGKEMYGVTLNEAGTTADFILIKDGKRSNITLTRMNIEDIEDVKTRTEWETLVSKLGNRTGIYFGNSLSHMTREQAPRN